MLQLKKSFTVGLSVFASLTQAALASDYRDSNACVQFMPTSLAKLSRSGQPLRVRTSPEYPTGTQRPPLGLLNGNFMRHVQGVARLQGRNTLVMSGNASGGSYLYVAQMQSQAEDSLWKSNVKCKGSTCSIPSKDMIYKIVHLSKKYDHPGGIQSVGDFVVVGTDISINDSKGSEVRFFDLRDPNNPNELTHLKISREGRLRTDAVAAIKLRGGRHDGLYLVAAMALKAKITFYLSTHTNLLDPQNRFEKYADWNAKDNFKPHDFQAIQLVQQCDGELYLIGAYKSKPLFGLPWGGKDWLDTFTVRLDVHGYKYDAETGNPVPWIEPYKNLHMTLKQSFFTAGAGVYVDEQTQKLAAYATDYWPLNPAIRDTTLRFEQFSPK